MPKTKSKTLPNPAGLQFRPLEDAPRRANKKPAGPTPLDRRRLLGVSRMMRRAVRQLQKTENLLLLAEINLAEISPGLRRRSPGIAALQKRVRELRTVYLEVMQLELRILDSMPASIREGLI